MCEEMGDYQQAQQYPRCLMRIESSWRRAQDTLECAGDEVGGEWNVDGEGLDGVVVLPPQQLGISLRALRQVEP